jgi:nitrate reductase alpha subunit
VARNNPLVPEDIKGAELTIVKDNRNGQVKVKSFKTEDEQIIYCHSDMKEKKENAMRKQYEKRFEDDFKKIIEALQKKNGVCGC